MFDLQHCHCPCSKEQLCTTSAAGRLLAPPVRVALRLKLPVLPWGPTDSHLKGMSALAPSVLLKAGGCHPLFVALSKSHLTTVMALTPKPLALWAGSSSTCCEGHRGGGRVSQARSKTEPRTTSCWQVAQAGCRMKTHPMHNPTQACSGRPAPAHSASLAKLH